MFSVVMVMPYQASFTAWLFVPLLMLPMLLATAPKPKRLLCGWGLAMLPLLVASIIIPNCCPTWCWMEIFCWW